MVYREDIEDIETRLDKIKTKIQSKAFLNSIRVIASNYRSDSSVLSIIDKSIEKFIELNDKKGLVNLYGLKVLQLEHIKENLFLVSNLIQEMHCLAEKIEYEEGIALSYAYLWYHEKFKGNKKKSKKAILKAVDITKNLLECDEYIHHFIQYSYAVELWLEDHDTGSSEILEEIIAYYYKNGFYRSFAQTIGLLSIIYLRTQKVEKGLEIIQNVFSNRLFFRKLPYDVKGIVYYFAGLTHMLNTNLYYSEKYFRESYTILKSVIDKSIYSSNFIVLHSFLSMVMALQGKIELASETLQTEDIFLQNDHIKGTLDRNTKNQNNHTQNLTKYYVVSRMGNYHPDNYQVLINNIYHRLNNCYSNFIALSEYILNANLDSTRLKMLLNVDNFSVNRVKHIIEFKIEEEKNDFETHEEKLLNCISILENRTKTEKTTFIENAYADLLIAQQLFTLNRYTEIYPLLKKYEKQLHRIEVLELRIFMEAFIQVGAYKSGDPLGPALQYLAIKKCRMYGFSRLESILLNYLEIQKNEVLDLVV